MLLWVKVLIKVSLLLIVLHECGAEKKTNITLAILVPWFGSSWDEGPKALSAAFLAIDEVNKDPDLLPNYHLNYIWKDDGCNVPDSLGNATYLWRDGVDAFIGPSCSESCESTGNLAQVWDLPMISWSCTSPALSDKSVYPTFVRTAGPYKILGQPYAELMKEFKWFRCAILSANQNLFSQSARSIQNVLESTVVSNNTEDCKPGGDCRVQVTLYKQYYAGSKPGSQQTRDRERDELLEEIKGKARVIFILGYTDDIRDFMLRAKTMDMLEGYAWIGVDILDYKAQGWMKDDVGRDPLAKEAFQGLISYTVAVPNTDIYKAFERKVKVMTKEEFGIDIKSVSSYAQNLYDAVYLYADSLQRMLDDDSTVNIKNGRKLAKYMMNSTVRSLGRDVLINSEGDRLSDFEVSSYYGSSWKSIAAYTSGTKKLNMNADVDWVWPGNQPETAVPHACGDGSICMEHAGESMDKIVIAIVAVLLVLIIICVVIFVWRRHEQAERDKKLWIIPRDDIRVVGTKYRSSISIAEDTDSQKSQFSIYSSNEVAAGGGAKAIYKGQVVGIHKLQKTSVTISPTIIKEFKTVRELSHENINPIFGACPEPNNIIIVSGVMGKGTLQDILSDEKITLDDMFKSSMISDAAKALEYLHKSVLQYHGNLTSNALGVDSHWVLKISDYGLHEFRSGCSVDENEDHIYTSKFWKSPELVSVPSEKGTQKGDIYAFGIIINEILTRRFPYETYNESPKEIVEMIATDPPFRPEMDPAPTNQLRRLQELVRQMWTFDPHSRPDNIGVIRRELKSIYPEKSRSITERVIMMMEKYATNLEIKVEERTAELQVEKQKADELLYRMMPRTVAEKLKQGNAITAELFDNVTVYFSDVVSFTNLCGDSTPMEVVAFLDDMYTMFDSIIESYDVYKVETIGDAYMLVSGLPNRNGDNHVVEITETALALINGTSSFKVRHKPGYQLRIRVGIHTGPCCAGVVGKTMPRYCLFGDTINTASRMESNGQAMKVHMSETTYELLLAFDYYVLTERGGTIAVKGKGDMKTYFCEGHKEGTPKPKSVAQNKQTVDLQQARSAPPSRAPPKGYRPLKKSSPVNSIHSSPGLDSHNGGSRSATEPLLKNNNSDFIKKLDVLEQSAV